MITIVGFFIEWGKGEETLSICPLLDIGDMRAVYRVKRWAADKDESVVFSVLKEIVVMLGS